MKISISMSDTVPEDIKLLARKKKSEQRILLDKLKHMLEKLRAKYTKASEASRKSILTQMKLVKQRFNKIYEAAHGEPYYSLAAGSQLSASSDVAALKTRLKEISAKVKYTQAYTRLRLTVESCRIKISNQRKRLKHASATQKKSIASAIEKLQVRQKALQTKRDEFARKNKGFISSTPVHKLQQRATVLAEKIKRLEKAPAKKSVKTSKPKSPATLRKAHDNYERLLSSKKPVSGAALQKARETVIKKRFDMGL